MSNDNVNDLLEIPSSLVNLTPVIRKIATDDEAVLKMISGEVPLEDIKTEEILQLLRDMIETMKTASGIGLAAPQIYVSKRIIVFYLPSSRDDSGVTPLDDENVSDFEGCLSVPAKRGKVTRAKRIKYTGYSETGEAIERIAEGWHARLIQHEYDHLNGVLYTDIMANEDKLYTLEEYQKLMA